MVENTAGQNGYVWEMLQSFSCRVSYLFIQFNTYHLIAVPPAEPVVEDAPSAAANVHEHIRLGDGDLSKQFRDL
jgi:hypothetical protein